MGRDMSITAGQFDKLKHAIGYEHGAAKRGKYQPYRNFFTAAKAGDAELDALVQEGLVSRHDSDLYGGVVYHLTDDGLTFVGNMLGIVVVSMREACKRRK